MQVAPRGPSGGAHQRDDLAYLHLVAGVDADGLKVVVGGDESVAVVDFYAVAAAPRMPSGRAHNTGISCVDGCPAWGRVILAQVEISRGPADRTDPETEGRTRIEELERGHQEAGQRPARARGAYRQGARGVLRGAPNGGVREGQGDLGAGQDGGRKCADANLVRRLRSPFPWRFLAVRRT
ncbi:hypothetical protein GCM10007170_23870 [Arthrobacter liuii]|uniref:Uncharacterized protein n=1 Tax=Arthrobacter liuii TaxID=1476996 RepID=A0ABQ2AUH9_9MICC|nr:hypothetical protein GCM10007170_23870 [Arthrobacter liuii]